MKPMKLECRSCGRLLAVVHGDQVRVRRSKLCATFVGARTAHIDCYGCDKPNEFQLAAEAPETVGPVSDD